MKKAITLSTFLFVSITNALTVTNVEQLYTAAHTAGTHTVNAGIYMLTTNLCVSAVTTFNAEGEVIIDGGNGSFYVDINASTTWTGTSRNRFVIRKGNGYGALIKTVNASGLTINFTYVDFNETVGANGTGLGVHGDPCADITITNTNCRALKNAGDGFSIVGNNSNNKIIQMFLINCDGSYNGSMTSHQGATAHSAGHYLFVNGGEYTGNYGQGIGTGGTPTINISGGTKIHDNGLANTHELYFSPGATVTIDGAEIYNSYPGAYGIYTSSGTNLFVNNTSIHHCGNGIWLISSGAPSSIQNTVIASLTALYGFGINIGGNNLTKVQNCTFYRCPYSISIKGTRQFIRNCIFQEATICAIRNDEAQATDYLNSGSGYNVFYANAANFVLGSAASTDTTSIDPRLIDPNNKDFHLNSDSPCINTGDPDFNLISGANTDIDGQPRIVGCRVDIGTDEFVYQGDTEPDGDIDFADFAVLADYWQDTNCGICGGIDLNHDEIVDTGDLMDFAEIWLKTLNIGSLIKIALNVDPCWTAEGQWQFGKPMGMGGSSYGYPDPNQGFTGQNVYGVNLNGDYNLAVGGPYWLRAGPFNCNRYEHLELHFARWLNTDISDYVKCAIEVSNNGSDWQTIWINPCDAEIADNHWQQQHFDISSIADRQPVFYVRWGYQIIRNRAYPYSGWNIDDVELICSRKIE